MRKKSKTIFLTGGTGFLGSVLLPRLLDEGYKIKALVRSKDGPVERRLERFLSRLRDKNWYLSIKNNIEAIAGDVTMPELGILKAQLEKIKREVDTVFHCAAIVKFDDNKRDELEIINVLGTKNVLDFMRHLPKVNFHFISTAYIAGKREGVVTEDELDCGQGFKNPYEETKFKAEKLIREYKVKSTVYRPSVIMGDSNTGETYSFHGIYGLAKSLDKWAKSFKRKLAKDPEKVKSAGVYYKDGILIMPMRIGGRKEKVINIVPVDYVISTIMTIFKREDKEGKVYHIVNNNHSPTVGDIQEAVYKNTGMQGSGVVDPSEFGRNPMTKWDKYFTRNLKRYVPYFQGEEPIFDDKNTRNALQGTSITCPPITQELLDRFIAYCIKTNWAERKL